MPPRVRKKKQPNTEASGSEIVLLALTGMSPAVLTETIWALGHGTPPIIPDRVVAITTESGRECLERELFQKRDGRPCVWESLRNALLDSRRESKLLFDALRLVTKPESGSGRSVPLHDIRTRADQDAAADFLLEEIRRITENPDTTLIASLAGGRKTMGALLYGCMSLLGRPQDRLTHVLVSEPFENPALDPRFYFPEDGKHLHLLRDGKTGEIRKIRAAQAELTVTDVPFVRLRALFSDQIGKFPGRFSALVKAYEGAIREIENVPKVSLAGDRPVLSVNGTEIRLSAREYALYAFLLERKEKGADPNIAQKDAAEEIGKFIADWSGRFPETSFQRRVGDDWKKPVEDDIRKQLASIRRKLRDAGLKQFEKQVLPNGRLFQISIQVVENE